MHRSGPNYQPYNSNNNHNDHNDNDHRSGPHRSGRYPADLGSKAGRNKSPPGSGRKLRHSRSLFELGKFPPEIPFFTRGPLDSVRTVSGSAVLQRRAALRGMRFVFDPSQLTCFFPSFFLFIFLAFFLVGLRILNNQQ